MKIKPIIQIVLAVAIIVLGYVLYSSITKPMKFENEFNIRRDACAKNLKAIRTLEEAYKLTYGCYCGSFDTLVGRLLNEDSLVIKQKVVNRMRIPEDVSVDDMLESDAIKKGYITIAEVHVNPVAQLREQGKLNWTDADGAVHEFSDEDLMNLRYVPYPKGEKKEFHLEAGFIEKTGYSVPVFECKVDLADLLSDLDHQAVINRIAEIERVSTKYAGWKVGDMTQAITEGNFE